MKSTNLTDELAQKVPLLETEMRRLRRLIDEVKSTLDELRRDRDQKLAEQPGSMPSGIDRRDWWFCGRASARG